VQKEENQEEREREREGELDDHPLVVKLETGQRERCRASRGLARRVLSLEICRV
jgi:hypothetical protein